MPYMHSYVFTFSSIVAVAVAVDVPVDIVRLLFSFLTYIVVTVMNIISNIKRVINSLYL